VTNNIFFLVNETVYNINYNYNLTLQMFSICAVNFIHQPSAFFTSTGLTFQTFLTFLAWGKYIKLFSWYMDVCSSLFYKTWTPSCYPLSLPYIMQTNQINWSCSSGIKIAVFWNMMLCSVLDRYQHFRGILWLNYKVTWNHVPSGTIERMKTATGHLMKPMV
jgi:hypothetical protein